MTLWELKNLANQELVQQGRVEKLWSSFLHKFFTLNLPSYIKTETVTFALI